MVPLLVQANVHDVREEPGAPGAGPADDLLDRVERRRVLGQRRTVGVADDLLLVPDPRAVGDGVAVLAAVRDEVRGATLRDVGAGLNEQLVVDEARHLLLPRHVRARERHGRQQGTKRHHDVVQARIHAQLGGLEERRVDVRGAGPREGLVVELAAVLAVALETPAHPLRAVCVVEDLFNALLARVDDVLGVDAQVAFRTLGEDGATGAIAVARVAGWGREVEGGGLVRHSPCPPRCARRGRR